MPNVSYTIKERITSLETEVQLRGVRAFEENKALKEEVQAIHGKVSEILENHLPHLEKAISEVGWKVGAIVGGASLVGASLVPELIKILFNLK